MLHNDPDLHILLLSHHIQWDYSVNLELIKCLMKTIEQHNTTAGFHQLHQKVINEDKWSLTSLWLSLAYRNNTTGPACFS